MKHWNDRILQMKFGKLIKRLTILSICVILLGGFSLWFYFSRRSPKSLRPYSRQTRLTDSVGSTSVIGRAGTIPTASPSLLWR